MDTPIIELIQNGVLLIALSIIFEISYFLPSGAKKYSSYLSGILIGLVGIAIMAMPFTIKQGVTFDTRSILISVSALVFGAVPAAIACAFAIAMRLFIGGSGVLMGIAVILSSAAIGLLWRRYFFARIKKHKWFHMYLFGLTVHAVMLLCTFFLPEESRAQIQQAIGIPVILLYPLITVLLTSLLFRQRANAHSVTRILEAEGRYKSLFDYNTAIMLIIDPKDGQIIDANNAASLFYGWSIEELKKKHISHINQLPWEQLDLQLQQSASKKQNYFIFRHKKASGEVADVEVYSGPINFKGHMLVYSIVHDVSARSAALLALQESESRFRTLVEGAPDTIFIETGGKFSFVNQRGIQLFGAQSIDDLLGKPVMESFHPDYHEVISERIKILSKEKRPVPPNEEIFLQMDGTPVWVEAQAVPVSFNQVDGAIVFARDITEKKKQDALNLEMEAQFRQQQKLEAIGTLAGGVAHEINNPINGIMNYAQLILDSKELTGANEEFAQEIIHETERISVIVKNLLQFSRLEKQSHSYASIYDIIMQTVSLIQTIIKKDQIDLQIELADDLPDIKCRSQQIQQVLMNLLTNARDALNEKFPAYDKDKIIRLTCRQYMSNCRRWLQIVVEDHGNGIPPEIQEKIFEPFFSTKTKDKGTGLGLSISFGIVKDHHGKLSLQVMDGEFTRFYLDLPVDNGWDLEK